jgi:hypothetical protein
MEDVTRATFEPHVGTDFVARADDDGGGGGLVTLKLREVQLEQSFGGPRAEPFRLVFEGPADRQLPQQTYELDHAALGPLAVFLVPTAPGEYEAVFN